MTATGEHKIINQNTDPDYFYAVRGGGGSAWGVITSATYKTHPAPAHMHVGLVQFNGTDDASRRLILEKALAAIPSVTEGGYIGYGTQDQGFQAIFSQPNGTNETFMQAFAPFFEMTQLPGVNGQVGGFELPSWRAYLDFFLTDPNIAINHFDTSRLVTKKVLQTKNKELADLALQHEAGCGFNFSKWLSPHKQRSPPYPPMLITKQSVMLTRPNVTMSQPMTSGRRVMACLASRLPTTTTRRQARRSRNGCKRSTSASA